MLPINKYWPFNSLWNFGLGIYYNFLSGYVYAWIYENGEFKDGYFKPTPEGVIKYGNGEFKITRIAYFNKYPVVIAVKGSATTLNFETMTLPALKDTELKQLLDNADIRAMIESVLHGDLQFYATIATAGFAFLAVLYLGGWLDSGAIHAVGQKVDDLHTFVNNSRLR